MHQTKMELVRAIIGSLAVFAVLSVSTGCALTPAPAVKVIAFEYDSMSDEAATYELTVEVVNRSGEEIGLHEFTYTATSDSGPAYDGRWAAPATLAPEDAARFSLPVVFHLDAFESADADPERIESIEVSGRLEYTTPDELALALYDAGLRRPRVRFAGAADSEDGNGP